MKLNQRTVGVVIVITIILAGILVWMYTGYTITTQKTGIKGPQPSPLQLGASGSFYENEAKNITDVLKGDADYLSCLKEGIKPCSPQQEDANIEFPNAFDGIIAQMKSMNASGSLDACYADAIRNCVSISVNTKAAIILDPASCEAYKNSVEIESCKVDIYTKIALKNDDIAACGNIEDSFQKVYCQDTYNMQKSATTDSPSWCDRISEESQRNICKSSLLTRVAIATKNPEKCTNYIEETDADSCLASYALQIQDTTQELQSCDAYTDLEKYFRNKKQPQILRARCLETGTLQSILQPINPAGTGSVQLKPLVSSELLALCNNYPDSTDIKACNERMKTFIQNNSDRTSPNLDATQNIPVPRQGAVPTTLTSSGMEQQNEALLNASGARLE